MMCFFLSERTGEVQYFLLVRVYFIEHCVQLQLHVYFIYDITAVVMCVVVLVEAADNIIALYYSLCVISAEEKWKGAKNWG